MDRVFNPDQIVAVPDHSVPAMNIKAAKMYQKLKSWVQEKGIKHFYDVGRGGIAHVVLENTGLMKPGQTLVSGDSQCVPAEGVAAMQRMISLDKTPVVIGDVLNHYVKGDRIVLPDGLDFADLDRVTLVGCGTAHLAGHVAKYWFEQLAGLPCDIDVASEFRYREPPLSDRSLFIAVSQSGETADTLAALHYARGKVARTVGLVNVGTSAIARDADMALPTLAGIEVSVASSKAFTCQLAVLAVLALKAAHDRGRLDDAALTAHLRDLRAIPALLAQALALSDDCRMQADWLAQARDVLYLGRGALYPVALEGALKLKELSYIHAEGYASGELKHGPIALIDGDVPVVVLAPHDALFDKTISNMQEVMARHGQVLLISDAAGIAAAGDGITASLALPTGGGVFQPILYAVPMQYLAYHTAVAKGTDVDQPRNLAKSVTVE